MDLTARKWISIALGSLVIAMLLVPIVITHIFFPLKYSIPVSRADTSHRNFFKRPASYHPFLKNESPGWILQAVYVPERISQGALTHLPVQATSGLRHLVYTCVQNHPFH